MKKNNASQINDFISIKNLTFYYGNRQNLILRNVSINIMPGKITTLVGSNGAGKSTLLKCCNKLLPVEKSKVFIMGDDINKYKAEEISKIIGYVPQKYFVNLSSTVFENVLLGINQKKLIGYSESEIKKAENIISKIGISNLSDRKISNLSSGQQQKVAIARALVDMPKYVFLDEPTSGLDIKSQRDLMKLLVDVKNEYNTGILTILHDINLASEFSDVIIMLCSGRIFASGEPKEVINSSNIMKLFEIESIVTTHNGRPYVLPI